MFNPTLIRIAAAFAAVGCISLLAVACRPRARPQQTQTATTSAARPERVATTGASPSPSTLMQTARPNTNARPVAPVPTFDFYLRAKVSSGVALIDTPPLKNWNHACDIYRGCAPPRPLRRCSPSEAEAATPTSNLPALETVDQLELVLKGPLLVSSSALENASLCPDYCCRKVTHAIVLGDGPWPIALEGQSCPGDDSRLCCNLPADGRLVVARGWFGSVRRPTALPWLLSRVTLCEISD